MKRVRLFLYTLIIMLPLLSIIIPNKGYGEKDSVYFIPVQKTVEQGLAAFIDRSITDAEEKGVSHIILELHTPGGDVEAAVNIGKRIKETDIPVAAYVNTNAISAGAYIALNADEIYMAENATIGAAGIIDQAGNAADEKAQDFWHSKMRTAAEQNGRDPIYALAMADKDIVLPDEDLNKSDFLTLTANQALQVNYAEGIVKDRADLIHTLGYDDPIIEEANESFFEKVARFLTNPIVVPILLSIGSLGLVVELYSPGFGVPGFMGISALLLFFYGHLVAGLAGMEALILFIVGCLLLIAEFFVPGGIIGLIGLGAILTSFFIAADNVMLIAVSLLIALIVTIVGMILMASVFGKKIKIFKKIVLKDLTSTESGYVSNQNRTELLGRRGVALTTLRPSGTIILDNERIDVVTEGSYIDRNKKVEVIKAEGSRIVVREIAEHDNL